MYSSETILKLTGPSLASKYLLNAFPKAVIWWMFLFMSRIHTCTISIHKIQFRPNEYKCT